ncbi:MAG: dephospho-CoA kinase [Chromatiales bacterium]|jgi:dephospho-CoA kinase|nr:dephospho-CoA kinase [Chromatiales bacterium]MDP6151088.1 dephospho-CoA kinase [Gammaproteobacteria bacterium]MDP7093825.1 dephospho-CoA kinase [Gammaproteobacteria bacterium]MDP7270020.1 dephospho-CoA kinase [Gammaproteobacteria bacterium]HJP04769.1 dephospho-CoA kinase [Gammaproteobacteria bacterium]
MSASLRIGLTGGIASGKTAVANMFIDHDITVIDTDMVAREVVEPGEPGLAAVVEEFGNEILNADGSLDRARLRSVIFDDPDAKEKLEAILHPLIRKMTFAHAQSSGGPYQVFAVPLLAETDFNALVDRVLVIDCPGEMQLKRLMIRDGETETSARNILGAQASREDRLAIADDVITNTGSITDLQAEVERLHQKYLGLAGEVVR